MKHATFSEYQEAKKEIIGGVEYEEETQFPNQCGMSSKQYHTIENGTFYEVTDPNTGITEFWSDKHADSRIYDENAGQTITFCEMHKQSGGCKECPNRYVCKNIADYDKFVIDRGWEFKTDEALKMAYGRLWKSKNNILITQDEFLIEVKAQEIETAKATYNTLAMMVDSGKLTPADIYQYARFKWCLKVPDAVIAYQTERNKWEVNNCGTETTEEAAKIAVCEEFGFEASRIRIIGTPYYDATDYNFIRFNCGSWAWLMRNGGIYQVYQ